MTRSVGVESGRTASPNENPAGKGDGSRRRDERAERDGAPQRRRISARVVWLLTRAEGRRLSLHPAPWLGALLGWVLLVNNGDGVPIVPRDATTLALFSLPLTVGLLLACYLAAGRIARHGTEELLAATPVDPATRAVATATSLVWASLAGVLWVGTALVLITLEGGIGHPAIADVGQVVLIATLSAAVGSIAGTWLPRPTWLAVVLAVLGGAQLILAGARGPMHTLAPILPEVSAWQLPELVVRPIGWHLVYLAGLVCLAILGVLMRHRVDAARLVAATVAVALAVAGGIGQFAARPSFDEVARLIAAAQEPDLVCVERGAVTTCTLPRYEGLGDAWVVAFEAVSAAAPQDAALLGPVRLTQSFDAEFNVVFGMMRWYGDDDVMAFQSGSEFEDPWLPDLGSPNDLHLSTVWRPGADGLALAVEAARRLVGIPAGDTVTYELTADDIAALREVSFTAGEGSGDVLSAGDTVEFVERCWLAGQAREVVAIWLAASADDRYAEQLQRTAAAQPLFDVRLEGGQIVHDPRALELGTLDTNLWSKVSLQLAVQLLEVPGAVGRLQTDWDRWTAADTTTDELAAAFGLTPLPTWDDVSTELGIVDDAVRIDPFAPPALGPIDGTTGEPADVPRPVRHDVSSCTE